MKCAVVRSEKRNGQVNRITDVRIGEFTVTQAENMSELATVVVMRAGIRGLATIYEDRVTRQALVDLEALESFAMECERRRLQMDGRNSWIG